MGGRGEALVPLLDGSPILSFPLLALVATTGRGGVEARHPKIVWELDQAHAVLRSSIPLAALPWELLAPLVRGSSRRLAWLLPRSNEPRLLGREWRAFLLLAGLLRLGLLHHFRISLDDGA